MRWSLERMMQELRDPKPGGSLIAQQLAYMILVHPCTAPSEIDSLSASRSNPVCLHTVQ